MTIYKVSPSPLTALIFLTFVLSLGVCLWCSPVEEQWATFHGILPSCFLPNYVFKIVDSGRKTQTVAHTQLKKLDKIKAARLCWGEVLSTIIFICLRSEQLISRCLHLYFHLIEPHRIETTLVRLFPCQGFSKDFLPDWEMACGFTQRQNYSNEIHELKPNCFPTLCPNSKWTQWYEGRKEAERNW